MHDPYDVIIVGAGIGGLCAAIQAASDGARTLLLEKGERYGGSTRMAGGAFAFAGTDLQQRAGIDDSAERLAADLIKVGRSLNDPALVQTFAGRQLEACRWLLGLGLSFHTVALSGGQSVPRNHSLNPVAMLDTLHRRAIDAGVAYRSAAPVARLVAERGPRGARVTGVELADGGRIPARGGVILATGGFSRNMDLVMRFAPHLRNALPMGGPHNTGDGLRMAWALGADLLDMGQVKGTFGVPTGTPLPGCEDEAPKLISAMYKGAVIVNGQGRRFVDESVSYKLIGDRCLEQPDAKAFQLFDASVMAQSSEMPTVSDYRRALRTGLLVEATTIDDLAVRIGVDAATLAQTIDRYNRACDGELPDEFGRTSLGTGFGKPRRIETAPFHALACTTGLTSTYCGLKTDTTARVVDVFGDLIAGLYAVGEIMGGFHGEAYMSGSSLAKAVVFARIAAADAARAAATAA